MDQAKINVISYANLNKLSVGFLSIVVVRVFLFSPRSLVQIKSLLPFEILDSMQKLQ
jgi:hypothetical protein